MQNSEKLCLKWNDFQENLNSAFGVLRNDKDFSDVTLACEDGTQVETHKVILASTSPFFMDLLKRNQHPHPFIYMRGVRADDLMAIVDFLYYGEANVDQENLEVFLALAEELRLKGLTGSSAENNEDKYVAEKLHQKNTAPKRQQTESIPNMPSPLIIQNPIAGSELSSKMSVALVSEEALQLDEQIKSMIEIGENMLKIGKNTRRARLCKVCGKEGQLADIMRHIEANHISDVSHSCDICGKVSRSRNGLRQHKVTEHYK